MITVKKKKLDGLLELAMHKYEDERGFSARIYDEREFKKLGFTTRWREITHQHSNKKNIVKGLYVQPPPHSEGKLLRVTRGELLWVSVDVRSGSKTFGQWDATILSGKEKNVLLTAPGFAHGCNSLTDDVDLIIISDNFFSAEHGIGIIWNDPELNIDWRLNGAVPPVSEAHKKYPSFKEFKEKYNGGI